MNKEITLSIIIPVYNVEKYIDECLMSIVEQKSEDIEVILINDGSTDASGEICEEYCEKYDYVKLYNQNNQGLSMARNNGMAYAVGKYLLFLDSDDYLIKDTLKNLVKYLKPLKEDVIVGKFDKYNEQTSEYKVSAVEYGDECKQYDSLEFYRYMTKEDLYWFQVSVAIVKREFVVKNEMSFKQGIFCEDELWSVELFLRDPKVKLYDKSYFCYREARKGSIINSRNIKKEFDKIIIMNEFAQKVAETNDKKKLQILKDRMSCLEWSIIQDLEFYADLASVEELKKALKERVSYLNYGKSRWKYWLCKLLGIEKTCKFNLKISLWRSVLTRSRGGR